MRKKLQAKKCTCHFQQGKMARKQFPLKPAKETSPVKNLILVQ